MHRLNLVSLSAQKDFELSSTIKRNTSELSFQFEILGKVEDLRLAPSLTTTALQCGTNLWESTCFEVFLFSITKDEYLEINVSPEAEFAVMKFDSYRKAALVAAPLLKLKKFASTLDAGKYSLEFTAEVKLSGPWAISPTVILEMRSGVHLHFAAAQNGKRADFHNYAKVSEVVPKLIF